MIQLIEQSESLIDACLKVARQRSFFNAYEKTFDIVPADTDALKEEVFRLRFAVLCEENGYERGRGQRMEYDAFDERAFHHVLMHKTSGEVAGTVRVLLPDDEQPAHSFPVQKVCDHPLLQMDSRVATLCEISNMCMARRFRRRLLDGTMLPAYYDPDKIDGKGLQGVLNLFRRRIPYAPLGLFRAAFETAMQARIMDCIMLLEPDQLESLSRAGLSYRVLGPRINHHGKQQPIVFNIKNVLDHMRAKNPHCWDVITDRGRLHKTADTLHLNDWHDTIIDENCRELIYRRLAGFEE